ncbi:MAG: nucleoside-triphosphatase [Myxococcales bacterium]|jgi:LAO/AO transport system kinase
MAEEPSIEGIARGDKTQVARALNLIENRRPDAQAGIEALLQQLPERQGMQRIGLTGPPGVGKSTLTAALARELRGRGLTVGVLAVDPSSMRSGGALLGDRARMSFDPGDQGLFVRSLATAGDTGGLAHAAHAAAEVLSAAYDRVIIETTGVGQTETDVEHVADTVCLVIQPGSGDVLQFIKAGIMEIPDVLVVNKGDHGKLARRAASDLEGALDTLRGVGMDTGRPGGEGADGEWSVPVLVTSARDRTGIDALADALDAHCAAHAAEQLAARRRAGEAHWALSLLLRRYGEHGVHALGGRDGLRQEILERLRAGEEPVALASALGARYLARFRD